MHPWIEDYYDHAVSVIQDYPFQSTDKLIDVLDAVDIDPTKAWELLTFIPIAYFRTLLRNSGVRFPEHYHLRKGDDAEVLRFDEQQTFIDAVEYAQVQFSRGMAREQLEVVIIHSCEFDPVNDALKSGIPPQEIELSPPQIWARGHAPEN